MNTKSAVFSTGLIALILLGPGWAGDRRVERGQALPDEAFTAIVREASKSIDSSLRKGEPRSTYITVRVNALVIALAADNRLIKKDADRSVADLRDAAVNLVEGLELYHTDRAWGLRLAALNTSDSRAIHAELAKRFAVLERLREQKPNGGSRPVRSRVSSRFTHEDVAFFFGGCGGNDGHKIESELLRLTASAKAVVDAELPPLELLSYKVALVGELLRDFDDHARHFKVGTIPERRKQWVGMAMDLEQAAWELADSARAKQVEKAREGVQKLDNACTACHQKVGFRHSQ